MSALHLVNEIGEVSQKPSQSGFVKLHTEAMKAATNLKTHYLKLFEILLKVESEQIYFQFEVPSFYLYCVELLELSPSVARDFITVVRRSLEVPDLAAAVRSKQVTIFKAKKICSVLNSANFKEWIELAATCSARIVEKAVAQANPREAVTESIVYASEDRLEIKLGVSEEWVDLLKMTKDRLSQKLKRAVSTEEALYILMSEAHRKNDPFEKAMRAEDKKLRIGERVSRLKAQRPISEKTSSGHCAVTVKPRCSSARYRPAEIEHAVNLRDQNQCAYIDARGNHCESKRWLHKHHVHHFADGGSHSAENLETLCSAHHKIRHMRKERVT